MGQAEGFGAYIAAYDEKSGEELWLLKIYDVTYDDDIEDDKQDVFITRLQARCGKYLIVENERGRRFTVDLRSQPHRQAAMNRNAFTEPGKRKSSTGLD